MLAERAAAAHFQDPHPLADLQFIQCHTPVKHTAKVVIFHLRGNTKK